MSLIPSWFGGRRSNVFDPFSLELWDPFKDFPFPNSTSLSTNFWGVREHEDRLEGDPGGARVKASMENGVLTVTVPKVEEKKPEVKAIEISG
ncbi:hypothetical protein CRG98_043390 [Punica granatum]|uniref:SHSP domain-containing protein n=1 Tax=Punica granatum TaxID=22663 RepID=A0A2I0HX20_PUNGR|nr:hypothetical protein CRG98_043390 [Punica granatum]